MLNQRWISICQIDRLVVVCIDSLHHPVEVGIVSENYTSWQSWLLSWACHSNQLIHFFCWVNKNHSISFFWVLRISLCIVEYLETIDELAFGFQNFILYNASTWTNMERHIFTVNSTINCWKKNTLIEVLNVMRERHKIWEGDTWWRCEFGLTIRIFVIENNKSLIKELRHSEVLFPISHFVFL